jgi:capsular exopolysaccharide synthesis family protein
MEQFNNGEQDESAVDIREYFHLIRSWAWLIVLAGVTAGAMAYAVSVRMTPIYEASTRLLLSAPSPISGVDPAALVTTQTMTTTYAQMLMDRPVLQGVIDQLKLGTTPEDLKRKKTIRVDTVSDTQLLVVTAEDPNPQRAADIANAMASVFSARIGELQSQRYSASRGGLAKQITDMEQQIATTTGQLAVIETQIAAVATGTAVSATQTALMTENPGRATQAALQAAIAAASGTAPAPQATPVAPPDMGLYAQLQERMTQYRTIYSELVTSSEQVRLSEDQSSTNVVVSEPAVANMIPVRPKTTLNTILAAVAGMLLAIGAVFAVDTLDDTVKNPDEIRRRFNLPILGMITRHESPQDEPITLSAPRSPTAEAFRSLRTSIMYAAVDRPLRRLMITSPIPQDGKTTISANLSVVVSQNEKLVLLIDADLRRPQVHRKFGLQNRAGLSELFVQPLERIGSLIQASAAPKLAVLTSGGLPPNPSELLTSKMMSQILDKLDQAFDLIVIDTPPVLSVTDAPALAALTDGVVLVVKPGTTKLWALRQALEQLRAVNARVLGVVLNEVNPHSHKYGYYYSRYVPKYAGYYETRGGGKDRAKKEKSSVDPAPPAGAR